MPPYSSSTVMPSTPSLPRRRQRSLGKLLLRSISAARGAISLPANLATVARRASMVAPRLKSKQGVLMVYYVYVNGIVWIGLDIDRSCSLSGSASSGRRLLAGELILGEQLAALVFEKCDLVQHHLDIFALLLDHFAPALELGHEFLQLLLLVARQVVEIEKFADLSQAEAEALAAQRELQAHPVAAAEEAVRAFPAGGEQALILVMPDGAGGDVEFRGKLSDGKGVCHCAMQYNCVELKCFRR